VHVSRCAPALTAFIVGIISLGSAFAQPIRVYTDEGVKEYGSSDSGSSEKPHGSQENWQRVRPTIEEQTREIYNEKVRMQKEQTQRKIDERRTGKLSEVIRFQPFDIDHSYVTGGVSHGGVVTGHVIPKIERCAYVEFRNNRRGAESTRLIREWDFRATFANGQTKKGMQIEATKYSIEAGETSTANVCFGINKYPVVGIDCDF
jgi:hypothetical protein